MPPTGVRIFGAPWWPKHCLESFQMCSSCCSIDFRHDVNLKQLYDPLQHEARVKARAVAFMCRQENENSFCAKHFRQLMYN